MWRQVLAVIVLFSVVPSVLAEEPMPGQASAAAVGSATPAPQIFCEQPEYDFGQISSATTVFHDYKICNRGNAELIITDVRASCGCTAVPLKEENRNIKPGDCILQRAEFDPRRFRSSRGVLTKTITVNSNDPMTPSLTLKFSAQIVDPVLIEPDYQNFGEVLVGSAEERYFVVRAASEAKFEVTRIDTQNPAFVAELVPPEQPGGESSEGKPQEQRIRVTLKNPTDRGPLFTTMMVYTNLPQVPTLEARLHATVSGVVQFDPRRFYLTMEPGREELREIRVRGRVAEGSTFEVKSAACNVDYCSVEMKGPEEGGAVLLMLKVAVPADTPPGTTRSGNLVIQTNVPGEEQAELPVTIAVRNPQLPQVQGGVALPIPPQQPVQPHEGVQPAP